MRIRILLLASALSMSCDEKRAEPGAPVAAAAPSPARAAEMQQRASDLAVKVERCEAELKKLKGELDALQKIAAGQEDWSEKLAIAEKKLAAAKKNPKLAAAADAGVATARTSLETARDAATKIDAKKSEIEIEVERCARARADHAEMVVDAGR